MGAYIVALVHEQSFSPQVIHAKVFEESRKALTCRKLIISINLTITERAWLYRFSWRQLGYGSYSREHYLVVHLSNLSFICFVSVDQRSQSRSYCLMAYFKFFPRNKDILNRA
jgi:hypothetical protein